MRHSCSKPCIGLLVCLLVGSLFFTRGFAAAKNTQLEIKKTQKYVNQIDKKIKQLNMKPAAKNNNKIIKLKKEKQAALQRIKSLKNASQPNKEKPGYKELVGGEMAIEQAISSQPTTPKAAARKQILVGMAGGAGVFNFGYNLPVGPVNEGRLEAGYGLGNQYSIINAGISGILPFGAQYIGLRLGVTNYSAAVAGVPGIAGTVPPGTKIGTGIFGGMKMFNFNTEIGYSSDLGLILGVVSRF